MTKIRNCNAAALNTGGSACQLDFSKVKGALILPRGVKLADVLATGETLTGATLKKACHNDRPLRVMPLHKFAEYAKDGGEPQVSAVGYGSNGVTDYSARTDTFTMDKYSEHQAASLSKTMNNPFDVYFYDDKAIYGINDGTDDLAGFPMSTIYPKPTPHPTSSNKAQLDVCFCHEDARAAVEDFDYNVIDFRPERYVMGLVPVKFVKSGNNWKLVEAIGGYDRTAEFGEDLCKTAANTFHSDIDTATYNAATETITVTFKDNATISVPQLLAPSKLYAAGVEGIEQAL